MLQEPRNLQKGPMWGLPVSGEEGSRVHWHRNGRTVSEAYLRHTRPVSKQTNSFTGWWREGSRVGARLLGS